MNKRRIWPLELLRICSILIVFAFHAMTHLGTSFSIFSQYIANGATYMVVFFMLSGFVIFLGHENSDWSNSKLLAYFYLRRLISIYPLYLFLHFTYEIVFRPLSVKENLLILPVELLGLQSFFSSVPFPVSWTVKMKKKQKETQDILSYHSQAAGCSDKARAKASGGRQPIEECGRTGL